MKTLSRIIADIRDLCGKPTRERVGDDVILGVIHNIQTSVNNEYNLASTNRLVEKTEFQLTGQEMAIPVSDFDSAERVMIVESGVSDYFTPLAIVGLDQMPGMSDAGSAAVNSMVSAVAFVGGRMYFDGVPASARVQLWYKPAYGEAEDLSDGLRGVPAAFEPLVVLRAAAFIRENHLDMSVTQTMMDEIGRLERQFKTHRTRGDESGLTKKSRYRASGSGTRLGYGPGRHRLIRG